MSLDSSLSKSSEVHRLTAHPAIVQLSVHMSYLPDVFRLCCHDEVVHAYFLVKNISISFCICCKKETLHQLSEPLNPDSNSKSDICVDSSFFNIRTQIGVHGRLQAPPSAPGCRLSESAIIKNLGYCYHHPVSIKT